MNYEDERNMARRIHGANHGAGLAPQTGQCNADTKLSGPAAAAVAMGGWVGPVTSIPAPDTNWKALGPIHAHLPTGPVVSTGGYLKANTAVSDSERMIQMLDQLAANFRQLGVNAENRLEQFCTPRAKSTGPDVKQTDTRQCESTYFRILESRVEMLNESLAHLSGLVNSVSAQSQGSSIQSAASGITTTITSTTPRY